MMVFSQLLENLRSRLALTCLLILAFAGGLFLTIGTTSYAEHSDEKLTVFIDAYSTTNRYMINKGQGKSIIDYARMPDVGMNILKFRNLIEQEKSWEVSSIYKKSLSIMEYLGSDELLVGYETGDSNRDIQYNETDIPYSNVKRLEVSPNFFKIFAVNTAEGKDFSDLENLQCTSFDTVYPIVMGWDYREFYAVGDKVTAFELMGYIGKEGARAKNMPRTFEVVGFLEPGAAIVADNSLLEEGSDNELLYLDRYILSPMVHYDEYLPQDDIEEHWVKYISIQELESYILISKQSDGELVLAVEKFGKQSGLQYVSASQVMKLTDLFRQEADQYFEVLKTTSWFIMIASVICLTVNLINKLISNLKKYSIHLISGGKLSDIRLYLVTEVLFIVLMSNLLAFTAALTFGGFVFSYSKTNIGGIMITVITPYSVLMACALSVVIIIVTLAIPLIKLERTEFDSLLRGRE